MYNFWKAAGIRCIKTICQTLVSMLPVGVVITPAIIQGLDWSVVYVIASWFGTALLAGLVSILTSIATGLPEVEYSEHIYMSAEEPADAEVKENDD